MAINTRTTFRRSIPRTMTRFQLGNKTTVIDPLKDGLSKVELLWAVGDDLEVVNDARVSYGVEHNMWQPRDQDLLEYLAWHDHWTPFAGNAVKFRITMPIFIIREWYRHEAGFVRNEVSRRYIKTEPQLYHPRHLRRVNTSGNKQGSNGIHDLSEVYLSGAVDRAISSVQWYNQMISDGVAPEQARMYLPQNMYTQFRETANIAAYIRLCGLRLSPAVMPETRAYAQAVFDILHSLWPISMETYQERWQVVQEAISAAYTFKRQARNSG